MDAQRAGGAMSTLLVPAGRARSRPSSSAAQANGWSIFGPPIRGRSCGSCKLCCTLVPVQLREGHKPSGVRCPHLTSRGCGIYATQPEPCAAWSCKWLFDEATAGLRRPDPLRICDRPHARHDPGRRSAA